MGEFLGDLETGLGLTIKTERSFRLVENENEKITEQKRGVGFRILNGGIGKGFLAVGTPGAERAVGEEGIGEDIPGAAERAAQFAGELAGQISFGGGPAGGQLSLDLVLREKLAAEAALPGGQFDGFGAKGAGFGLGREVDFSRGGGRGGQIVGNGGVSGQGGEEKGEKQPKGAQEKAEGKPGTAAAVFLGGDDDGGDAEKDPDNQNWHK